MSTFKFYSKGLHTLPVVPVRVYTDAELQKKQILLDNKGKAGIYRWINKETGKSYVGSAGNLSKRFGNYYSQYLIKEILGRSKSYILSAIQKYSPSSFSLEILEYCDPLDLIKREQYYIGLLKPEYNILQVAGSSRGRLTSEETRMKISNSLKGRSLSEATKQRMSEVRKGRLKTEGSGNPSQKVEVLNIETNETTIYPSCRKAAESIGCSDFTVRYYIKNKNLYKGKYFFKKHSS